MRYLTIILLVCISSYAAAQDSGEIFAKMIATMKSHNSLSYTSEHRIKYAHTNDTATHNGVVHMIRDERDTMMGGMVWQSDGINEPKHYSFYDLDMRYIVMHRQQKVWRETIDHNGMGLGTQDDQLLFKPFLKPADFGKYPYGKMEILRDTVIGKQPCYTVKTTVSPEFASGIPSEKTWYISKEDMFPILTVTVAHIDGSIQYDERRFISHEFDNVSEERFSPKQIPADYTVDARPGDGGVIRAK